MATEREPYFVLDCSKVDTPDGFFALCRRRCCGKLAVNPGGNVLCSVRAMAEFQQALLSTSVMAGARCTLEIRNIEALERKDAGFISELEQVAAEVNAAGVWQLDVLRFSAPPRGPIYWHDSFVTEEFSGALVERVIADGYSKSLVEVVFFGLGNGIWERVMFLDDGRAWGVNWVECADDDFQAQFDDAEEMIDLGRIFALEGRRLGTVEAERDGQNTVLRVGFLDGACLRMTVQECQDHYSASALTFDNGRAKGPA
jgi:hypothetical protein